MTCLSETIDTLVPYDTIYFSRQGGGNIEYKLSFSNDSINFDMIQYDFRENHEKYTLPKSQFDSSAIVIIDSLRNKKLPLHVPVKPTCGKNFMTGTWVYSYVINDNETHDTITMPIAKEAMRSIEDTFRVWLEK